MGEQENEAAEVPRPDTQCPIRQGPASHRSLPWDPNPPNPSQDAPVGRGEIPDPTRGGEENSAGPLVRLNTSLSGHLDHCGGGGGGGASHGKGPGVPWVGAWSLPVRLWGEGKVADRTTCRSRVFWSGETG